MAVLLGREPSELLRWVGLGLALFSIGVLIAGRRARIRPLEVLLISLSDFAWVMGSLGFLLLLPESFSATGLWLFGGVALLVAAFGVVQFTCLRRLQTEPTPELGKYRYSP